MAALEGVSAPPAVAPSVRAVEESSHRGVEERCARAACRICGAAGLLPVLDLGLMPPSDRLVPAEAVGQLEPRFPLELAFCRACALVQILETVPPELLFGDDYRYYSSFSEALLAHSAATAKRLIAERKLGPGSLVVELASNDGYLLRNFVQAGIPVLGIDPAPGQAAAARRAGVNTLQEFFSEALAEQLVRDGLRADVIIANNVFAHVADTNGFLRGITRLLADEGIVSIEVPYVRDLVDGCEFDTIYHEHLCYFSVTSAEAALRRNGLRLREVERIPIHGGSLRLLAGRGGAPGASVGSLLAEEQRAGMDGHAYYAHFGDRVRALQHELRTLLDGLRRRGKSIAAYGAAAKGTILLNAIGADRNLVAFVVDRNVHKHGRFMPGVGIPIVAPEELRVRRPDYVLLLTWNFADEILAQQAEYRAEGGRFIIPIPAPRVL